MEGHSVSRTEVARLRILNAPIPTLTLTNAPYLEVNVTLRQTQGHLFWPVGL